MVEFWSSCMCPHDDVCMVFCIRPVRSDELYQLGLSRMVVASLSHGTRNKVKVRSLILIIIAYSTSSTSSMICTLMLPLLRSPHVCNASNAFSKG